MKQVRPAARGDSGDSPMDSVQSAGSELEGYTKVGILPGLRLITLECNREQDLKVEFAKPDKVFEFGFVLSGHTRTTSMDPSRVGDFEMGACSVVAHYLPNVPARFEVKGNENARMLGIEIELPVLQAMLEDNGGAYPDLDRLFGSDSAAFYKRWTSMSALQQVAAHQILSCPFSGPARALFIQGKVFELISYQLEAMLGRKSARRTPLSPADVECIHHARSILKERMTKPPTLTELAALVGLNANKLKIGFKAVFDRTAFGCLHEDRMHSAQALLQERRLNVSEVAWEVGYTNVGHFSVAFRKFFGVRPKDFRAETGRHFHPGS